MGTRALLLTLLFKKSQKLLDRYLFLFFAEDRQLLPPNSVRMILSQWEQLRDLDEYTPLYNRFKKYFGYLNSGHKGKQYDIFAGLKGKLTNNLSYNIKGSYINERNKALFRSNDYTENSTNENYAFGNSMQVVYDDMRTLSFYGELKADFSDNVTFGVNGTFSSFKNDNQSEAWNLPAIRINTSLDFNITEKWFAGANLFYVGERKDYKTNMDIVYVVAPSQNPTTLKSYFDINANVGYNYSDRLTAFVRANNIANNGYQKWLNYPVQSFQLVLGANYKFDF